MGKDPSPRPFPWSQDPGPFWCEGGQGMVSPNPRFFPWCLQPDPSRVKKGRE